MNREEAIEMLKKDKEQRGDCFISDAIDMAIKALEQKPCGDYISREDAIMCMTGEYVADMTYKPEDIISKHIQRLRALPPVTPQEPSYNSVNSLAESKLKNPKAKNFDILRFVADNAGLSTYEAIEKAYNMGLSDSVSDLDKDIEAYKIAIDAMYKYQKIAQIIKDHDADNMPDDYWYIDEIREVIEDGND